MRPYKLVGFSSACMIFVMFGMVMHPQANFSIVSFQCKGNAAEIKKAYPHRASVDFMPVRRYNDFTKSKRGKHEVRYRRPAQCGQIIAV